MICHQEARCLSLSRRQIVRIGLALFAVEALFGLLHVFGPFHPVSLWRRLDLDAEVSIPAWFSSIQFFSVGMIAAYCGWKERGELKPWWRSGWMVIAVSLVYLSLDEAAELHGVIGQKFLDVTGLERRIPYWLIAFFPAMAAVGVFWIRFLSNRFRGRRILLLTVGVGLLSWIVALGCEASVYQFDVGSVLRSYEVAFEECFEMAGTTCLLMAFLRYANTCPEQDIRAGH